MKKGSGRIVPRNPRPAGREHTHPGSGPSIVDGPHAFFRVRAKKRGVFRKQYITEWPAQELQNSLCAEITGAGKLGIWIMLNGAPYFVAHEKTVWLRDPAVRRMLHISLPNGFHLRWDSLDADLDVDAL
ncbi:MAG: hypothetical protein JW832_01870 [Deltaproteobacteria bacterium]|nr:hypothetical protein [Deltaproteobacteria bacterium]